MLKLLKKEFQKLYLLKKKTEKLGKSKENNHPIFYYPVSIWAYFFSLVLYLYILKHTAGQNSDQTSVSSSCKQ